MQNSLESYLKIIREYAGKDTSFTRTFFSSLPVLGMLFKQKGSPISEALNTTDGIESYFNKQYSTEQLRKILIDINNIYEDLKQTTTTGIVLSFSSTFLILVINLMKDLIVRVMDNASVVRIKTSTETHDNVKIDEITTLKENIYWVFGYRTIEEMLFYIVVILSLFLILMILRVTVKHMYKIRKIHFLLIVVQGLIERRTELDSLHEQAMSEYKSYLNKRFDMKKVKVFQR